MNRKGKFKNQASMLRGGGWKLLKHVQIFVFSAPGHRLPGTGHIPTEFAGTPTTGAASRRQPIVSPFLPEESLRFLHCGTAHSKLLKYFQIFVFSAPGHRLPGTGHRAPGTEFPQQFWLGCKALAAGSRLLKACWDTRRACRVWLHSLAVDSHGQHAE